MKLPKTSVKIRYRSSPCLTNISSWLKGTFWLRSRQQSSIIGSMNIKIHREADVFDYMLSYMIESSGNHATIKATIHNYAKSLMGI